MSRIRKESPVYTITTQRKGTEDDSKLDIAPHTNKMETPAAVKTEDQNR